MVRREFFLSLRAEVEAILVGEHYSIRKAVLVCRFPLSAKLQLLCISKIRSGVRVNAEVVCVEFSLPEARTREVDAALCHLLVLGGLLGSEFRGLCRFVASCGSGAATAIATGTTGSSRRHDDRVFVWAGC